MCDACLDINSVPRKSKLLVNRVFQLDPTRTLTLRQRWVADFDRRFKALKKLITVSIIDNDCFGLTNKGKMTDFRIQAAAGPGEFAFTRSADKVEAFMNWLQEQEKAGLLTMVTKSRIGAAVEEPWVNVYIDTAYQQGIRRGRQELRKAGVEIPEFGDSISGKDSVAIAFNQPIHADRVGLIYSRVFADLKGITAAMDTQISRVLAQGIAEGRGPREIAALITGRVDAIGINRARILARTEVVRAHHSANVQEYRNAGVQGVQVQAEWLTAGDGRVCPVCSALQGKRFTLDEIEFEIPKHPNCRCVAIPDVSGKGAGEKSGKLPPLFSQDEVVQAKQNAEEAAFRQSLGATGKNIQMQRLFQVQENNLPKEAEYPYFSKAKGTLSSVDISRIVATQSEVSLSKVVELIDFITAGGELPAVKVAIENDIVFLLDGHHRVAAAKLLGLEKIEVEVLKKSAR